MTFEDTLKIALFTFVITQLANLIFIFIKDRFNLLSENRMFNREFNYIQLKELYLNLYSIISQSEYLRYFHDIKGEFKDIPFLEVEKRKEIQKKVLDFEDVDFDNFTFNTTEFELNDAVTEFSKKKLAELILENSKYSSQRLLKLAVAYRYVHDYYLDNTLLDDLAKEKFSKQELIIIRNLISTVVIDTNKMLKNCNMEYNKNELKNGRIVIDFEKV